MSVQSTSAPFERSNSTTLSWPSWAATCNGVFSILFRASRWHPDLKYSGWNLLQVSNFHIPKISSQWYFRALFWIRIRSEISSTTSYSQNIFKHRKQVFRRLPTMCYFSKKQGLIPAPGSAAIIYWYLGNGRGRLIDWQKKILLDGLIDLKYLKNGGRL